MLRGISRVVLAVAAGVLLAHAFLGAAVPAVAALAAALVIPAAIVGASVPPGKRGTVTTIVLATVLLAAAAAVPVASGRIAGEAGGAEIVAWLSVLLVLLGVAPAIVLCWAHAGMSGSREQGRETSR